MNAITQPSALESGKAKLLARSKMVKGNWEMLKQITTTHYPMTFDEYNEAASRICGCTEEENKATWNDTFPDRAVA